MKKILLSLVALMACYACEAQHSLTFHLSDVGNDSVGISVINGSFTGFEKTYKVKAENGTFYYDTESTKARMLFINLPQGGRMNVWAVPGEQGVLSGTTEHAEWSGSKFYTELASLEKITDPLQNEYAALNKQYSDGLKAGKEAQALQKELTPKFMEVSRKLKEARINYIKQHPASDVSMSLCTDIDGMPDLLSYVSDEAKTGVFSEVADRIKAQMEEQKAREEAQKKVAPGCVAPDFTLKDLNGKDLALSSLRGKYVILDFWGSWCGWCIKGFPEMKEYYKKYAGKFEILGVDCNDTEQKWKDAVAKNELPWKHVYCPRDNREILTNYAIEGFPTKIIIDPQGKIYKTIVGEDPAFYTLLDELFK